jgi:hypothetical protein
MGAGGSDRMTRTANARVAGVTFFAYIAAGITSMILFGRATAGQGVAARLATIADHPAAIGYIGASPSFPGLAA